jgi:hypothetical protein
MARTSGMKISAVLLLALVLTALLFEASAQPNNVVINR